ncbi:MAG: molybdopterin adenylyltransferase [Rhizobiaceae bacterium]|nr:molybdopterin adenylyltransferase [Rhizobiaceae bacterium]|tara:strand:- start:82 stop:603 length:522 start_codon:yes stop_codon:yes gene_type:complete
MLIVALTVSDRASRGEYEDQSGAMIETWLKETVTSPYDLRREIISDGTASVADALMELCDNDSADLILTTGGTGPAPRDQTPEAMQSVLEKELPGFGELMRRISLEQAPTAILSRQTAGVRGKSLIVNLPGRPASIRLCLNAVFPAIPYCLDLIGAGRIETDPARLKAHRPTG